MDKARKMALSHLHLSHKEFYQLTLSEFVELIEAKNEQTKEEYKKLAQLAVWITAPHLKKPLSVDKLVQAEKENKRIDINEKRKILQELDEELG